MNLIERGATIPDFSPNTRGHDKKRPRFISVMNPHESGATHDDFGHQTKSHAIYKIYGKIRALCNSPESFPDLGFIPTEVPIKKHNGQFIKVRRSDGREAIQAVSQYFVAYLDPISCKVGVRGGKKDGSFLTLDRDHILEKTGLTYDSFNESVKVMENLDMVKRQRCWKEKEDGTHGGRPSLYTLKDAFFEQYGIVEEFKSWSKYIYDKAAKAAGGILKDIAKNIATRFDGKADTPSVKLKTATFEPEEGTLAYYQNKIPKSKRGEYQYNVAMLMNDNPDLPKSEVFLTAFQAI